MILAFDLILMLFLHFMFMFDLIVIEKYSWI